MERLGVIARPRLALLDEECAEFVALLRLPDGLYLGFIVSENLLALYHDLLPAAPRDELVLMRPIVCELYAQQFSGHNPPRLPALGHQRGHELAEMRLQTHYTTHAELCP